MTSSKRGKVALNLEDPPVVETSIGFYFNRIEGWNLLHQGVLGEKYRSKYPDVEILPTVFDPTQQQKFQLDLNAPVLRTGFSDPTKTQLVQVQDGLLLHNWRKTPEGPKYRKYETIRAFLQEDWNTFRLFLEERKLKGPTVTRCEVSYFNHIVRSEGWRDFSDLPKTFTVWKEFPLSTSGGVVQMAAFAVIVKLDDGTVNFGAQPAIRASDGKEIIQFSLTASAQPASSTDHDLFECLDVCHENVCRVFLDFTTEKARERWRQRI